MESFPITRLFREEHRECRIYFCESHFGHRDHCKAIPVSDFSSYFDTELRTRPIIICDDWLPDALELARLNKKMEPPDISQVRRQVWKKPKA